MTNDTGRICLPGSKLSDTRYVCAFFNHPAHMRRSAPADIDIAAASKHGQFELRNDLKEFRKRRAKLTAQRATAV